MAINWKKEYNPDQLVSKIEAIRAIGSDGKVKFEAFEFRDLLITLFDMLKFSNFIPEREARGLLDKSIFEVGQKGELTTKKILNSLNRREREWLKQPTSRYVLLSSLSISSSKQLPKRWFGRDQVIFGKKGAQRFSRYSQPLVESAKFSLFGKLPQFYLPVRVHATAHSNFEAAELALEHLDLVRGVWNLFFNLQQGFRMSFGGKPKPVNRIISGPIHTLHELSGKLAATQTWWYEPSFIEPISRLSIDPKFDRLVQFDSFIFRKLEEVEYSRAIKNAIRRYARSLDERNWNNAFLRLWSVLELLTDTVRDRYDVTIRRAAFVFADRDYYLQVLKTLREYRNSSIHKDSESTEIEAYLYQLKNVVESLLLFHVGNKFKFASIQEASEFFSLPISEVDLKRRAKMIDSALVFRYSK